MHVDFSYHDFQLIWLKKFCLATEKLLRQQVKYQKSGKSVNLGGVIAAPSI